jgi:hypothetical protein
MAIRVWKSGGVADEIKNRSIILKNLEKLFL